MITLAANPTFAQLLRSPVLLLAFGLGSGLASRGPGTAGSVLALILWAPLVQLPHLTYLLIVFGAALLGIYLCGEAAKRMGVHDHGGIVWDEFVGLWIGLAFIPFNWFWAIAGFVLFRVLDIFKPWPIGWLDRRVSGGLGIMLDDILAGLFTALLLAVPGWTGWM